MRALYSIKKKIFSYYTSAKRPSTTFLYLWGSFTTTSTFLFLSSSNTTFLLFSIQHHHHHISLFPPPTHTHTHTHIISTFLLFSIHHLRHNCFPCTTTSTTILLFSVHNLNTCISFVFPPLSSPPPHFYLFSSSACNTFLWFLIRYIHHISFVSLHYYLHHIPIVFHPPPRPPFCRFSCTTSTTFLLFSSFPSSNTRFQNFPLLHHHPLIFMFSLFLC